MSLPRRIALYGTLAVLMAAGVVGVIVWDRPEQILALAAVFEAGVIAVAALVAWNQVTEMREMRLAQTRPYVIAYIQPDPTAATIVNVVIANTGNTVARDIKLTFAPQLSDTDGPAASFPGVRWVAFDTGLPLLAPGQRFESLWAQATTVLADGATVTKSHTVTIAYAGDLPERRLYSDQYVLDVGALFGLTKVAPKTQDDAIRALEGIRDVLNKWTERDGVRTYTEGLLDHRERHEEEIRTILESASRQPPPSEAPLA